MTGRGAREAEKAASMTSVLALASRLLARKPGHHLVAWYGEDGRCRVGWQPDGREVIAEGATWDEVSAQLCGKPVDDMRAQGGEA